MFKKHKKIFFVSAGIIILSVIILLIYFAVSYYQRIKSPKSPVVSAIPTTAAIIFEVNNSLSFWNKISTQTDFWKELQIIEPFNQLNQQIGYTDSIIKLNNDALSILQENPLYISMHPASKNICNFLFLTECSNRKKISDIEEIYKNIYAASVSFNVIKFKDINILEVKISNHSKSIFYTAYKGVLCCSYEQTLVEDAILQLNAENSLLTDNAFTQISQVIGKKVDANIFINYKQFHRILISLINDDVKENINFLPFLGSWCGLDLNIKPNALVLNGFTNPLPDDKGFLSRFEKQQPAKVELTKLLPHNTSSFLFLGFENFKLYFNKNIKQKENEGKYKTYISDAETFKNTYGVDWEADIADFIDSEIGYATVYDTQSETSVHNFLILRFKSIEKLNDISKLLTLNSKNFLNNKPDTTAYRDYKFGYFDTPEIFNTILGTSFNINALNMHCIIDNYMIMGASRTSLIHIINAVVFNRNLNNSSSYNNFSNLLSSKANIFLYFNTQHSLDLVKTYLNKNISDNISTYSENINRFQSFAIQISESNGLFYNNISVNFSPDIIEEESSALWETELAYNASDKVYTVLNHNDNTSEVIIVDEHNSIYLIDKTGTILWKTDINEKILSNIIQIDFYNNGKLQYIFNTGSQIYLIDRTGKNVAHFPVKLKNKATNGISIFDYDNNKNYRIFLANDKNEIINLDKNAEKVSGWKMYKTLNTINTPIQFIRLLGKDFILTTDTDGKIYILDRKGDIRIKTDKNIEKSQNKIYPLITADNKGKFVTTNKNGKIIHIDFNGKTEETHINDFSENHYFIFEDINNNTIKEYIFIDQNKLWVYDFNKTLIKEFSFEDEVNICPTYFNDNNKFKLGVVTKSGKIYLFNNEIELIPNFPIEATIPFALEICDNTKTHLIAANKKIVFKYLLE